MGILLKGEMRNVAMSLKIIKEISGTRTLKGYIESLKRMPRGERMAHCSAVAKLGREIRELNTENRGYSAGV